MDTLISSFLALLCLTAGASSQRDISCYQHILGSDKKGVIHSYNYPFEYPNRIFCRHRFYLENRPETSDRQLCFRFYRFQTEYFPGCQNDYLEYPGNTKYCGIGVWNHGRPVDILSNAWSQNFCWDAPGIYFGIAFYSDQLHRDKGFYATWEIFESQADARAKGYHVTGLNAKLGELGRSQLGNNSNNPALLIQTPCKPRECAEYCFHGYKNDSNGCPTCDCFNGSTAPCHETNYTCFNRKCIDRRLICNEVDDCGDGSDETYKHVGRNCLGKIQESCDFDIHDFCGYRTYPNGAWKRIKDAINGPSYDHTQGGHGGWGYFVYLDWPSYVRAARLTADINVQKRNTTKCISFWYYMVTDGVSLSLHLQTDNQYISDPIWRRDGHHGYRWLQGQMQIGPDINSIKLFQFIVNREDIYSRPSVSLDDVSIINGTCVAEDVSCTFQLDMCQWSRDPATDKDLYWRRRSGREWGRGPTTDRLDSNTGFYMYVEGRWSTKPAYLTSRTISHGLGGDKCIQFFFNLGNSRDTLEIYINHKDGRRTRVWQYYGQAVFSWQRLRITVKVEDGPFKISVRALPDPSSWVAFDDVMVLQSSCDVAGPTTTPPPAPEPTCTTGQHMCDHGRCVDGRYVCDGRRDCSDGSDEANCGRGVNPAIIAGALAAVGVVIIILIAVCFCCWRKKKSQRSHRRERRPESNFVPYDMTFPGSQPTLPAVPVMPPPYTEVSMGVVNPVQLPPDYESIDGLHLENPPPYEPKISPMPQRRNNAVPQSAPSAPAQAHTGGSSVSQLPVPPSCQPASVVSNNAVVTQGAQITPTRPSLIGSGALSIFVAPRMTRSVSHDPLRGGTPHTSPRQYKYSLSSSTPPLEHLKGMPKSTLDKNLEEERTRSQSLGSLWAQRESDPNRRRSLSSSILTQGSPRQLKLTLDEGTAGDYVV